MCVVTHRHIYFKCTDIFNKYQNRYCTSYMPITQIAHVLSCTFYFRSFLSAFVPFFFLIRYFNKTAAPPPSHPLIPHPSPLSKVVWLLHTHLSPKPPSFFTGPPRTTWRPRPPWTRRPAGEIGFDFLFPGHLDGGFMAPGARGIVMWSRPLALCPRAEQRHE